MTVKLLMCGLVLVATSSLAQPVDQARLVERLANGTNTERQAAINGIRRIPVAQREVIVVSALIEEVARLKGESSQRLLALQEGKRVPPVADEGEYLFSLMDTLAQHRDPIVLPSLLAFMVGKPVLNAIADFGEDAVDAVLVRAASNDVQDDPAMAMEVLSRMLERSGVRQPLSANSRRRLVDLAGARIAPGESVAIVSAAIRLAGATRHPALRSRLQELASSDQAVARLGVASDDHRRILRRDAARALQGVAAP